MFVVDAALDTKGKGVAGWGEKPGNLTIIESQYINKPKQFTRLVLHELGHNMGFDHEELGIMSESVDADPNSNTSDKVVGTTQGANKFHNLNKKNGIVIESPSQSIDDIENWLNDYSNYNDSKAKGFFKSNKEQKRSPVKHRGKAKKIKPKKLKSRRKGSIFRPKRRIPRI